MKKPPMGIRDPRTMTIMVRVSRRERDEIIKNSAGARSLSEYLREKLLEKKTA